MSELTYYQQAPTTVAPVADYQSRAVGRIAEWAASAQAAYHVAETLVQSAFVPVQFRGKPVEAMGAILAGAEVGLSPMSALKAFDIIQGQAAPRAITLRAVALSFGHDIEVTESTASRCVVRARRKGGNWQQVSWTIDRARDLGLTGKDQWRKQPQAMLVARATAEAARLVAADAILGIGYSSEEVADGADAQPTTAPEPAPETGGVRRMSRTRRAPEPAPDPEEPPLEDPAPADEPEPDGVTRPQLTALHAALTAEGFTDREAKLEWCSRQIGRVIDSSSQLTKAEASSLLDLLKGDA